MMSAIEKRHKEVVGTVVSDLMDKTIKVVVQSQRAHPQYKKRVWHRTYLMAHDEKNVAAEGDVVRIRETRPIAKNKSWRLIEVVRPVVKVGQKQKEN